MNAPTGKIEAAPVAGLDLLRAPFPDQHISKLPKPTKAQTDAVKADFKKGIRCDICGSWHHPQVVHLDYVGHAALTYRLLDADPEWTWEPLAVDQNGLPALDANRGLWIKLTVCGVTRLGYGAADGKQGGDAIKEIIGDALRNAAMRFGAALDLWHKGDLHLEDQTESGGDNAGESTMSPAASNTLRDQLEQSVAEVAPEAKWTEPGSMYSGIHKLKGGLRSLNSELEGCADSGMVYGVTATEEWKEFVRVAELHAPHYLRGGDPAPEEFEGLITKAERLVAEFDAAEANGMVDLVRAG